MKGKLVLAILITMCFIVNFSANARNIEVSKTIKTDNEHFKVWVGEIIIDCQYDDDLAVEIDVPDSPHRDIYPQGSEEVTFEFYLDWEILNPRLLKEEEYYFEIVLKDGGSPDSSVINEESLTLEGTLFDKSGNLTSGEISFGREDFDRDDFFSEPETKKIRAEIRGIYYQSGEVIDDDDLWTVTRIDMGNEGPTKPTLTGDINNGGEGSVEETYTFTAEGSTDPDGDGIDHYDFDFHDGTVESVYPVNGVATASHKWDEQGEKKVSVYAFDRFGAMSDGAEITFTLPKEKSKNVEKIGLNMIINKFPIFLEIFEKINF